MAKKEEKIEENKAKTTEAEKVPEVPVNKQSEETVSEVPPPRGADQSAEVESTKPAEPEKSAEPDWKTLYALTLADFDNYKKRAARDREDVYRYAESDILKDVLPAIDNLQLALEAAKNVDAEYSPRQKETENTAFVSFVKGVQLVHDTLLKSLKDHGAEPFDSVGKELDTEKMEAIATLPSDDVEEGKVSIESKKGWMLKNKVLRAAQVVVSSGKPE